MPVGREVTGVLLAAGSSTRFGGSKCLEQLSNGKPVALQSACNLEPAVDRLVCVVRPGDEALIAMLRKAGFECLEAPEAEEGMGASVRTGIEASINSQGWLLALGDMPWIQPGTCIRIAEVLRSSDSNIVAPVRQGKRGHPVGFPAVYGNDLRALKGDRGARSVIHAYRESLELLETDDPGVLMDIDYRSDLERPF